MRREPIEWPNRARIAVTLSIAWELWSEGMTPGKNSPPGFFSGGVGLQPGEADIRSVKMAEYGGKVGIWRLIDILKRQRVKATVFSSARAVEKYPEAAKELLRIGCEIAAHSYAQDISSLDFTDSDQERRNIKRCVSTIEEACGERPVGWVSPRAAPSPNTLRLLAEEGFIWCADYPDDDLPYPLRFNDKTIIVIPYSGTGVNDLHIEIIAGQPPSVYSQWFKENFNFLYEEGVTRPNKIRAGIHAHIYGRHTGAYAFEDVIKYAKGFPDVWMPTMKEIAEWWLKKYC